MENTRPKSLIAHWPYYRSPGNPDKQPSDLRPLGLQDPSAKIYAAVLRGRIEQAKAFLQSRPQLASCAGRAIDEASARVAQHCWRVGLLTTLKLKLSSATVYKVFQGTLGPALHRNPKPS